MIGLLFRQRWFYHFNRYLRTDKTFPLLYPHSRLNPRRKDVSFLPIPLSAQINPTNQKILDKQNCLNYKLFNIQNVWAQWLPLSLKNGGQMNIKTSGKLIPTSLIAFFFLCALWFLKVTGLLSEILHAI